jgi:hypothetical protein
LQGPAADMDDSAALRRLLLDALEPYPDARAALASVLERAGELETTEAANDIQ